LNWLIHDPLTLFLAQIVAIIAACRGMGLVMRRIGQPSVIAEICAGILLGPSVLGWLAPDVFGTLFPPGSLHVVRMVSQIGLLLFMFLVGLELDLRLLRGRLRSSLAISLAGIVLPFALGIALAASLRAEFAPSGVTFGGFAVFMGVAMSITAFPVLARILAERRLLRTRVGTVAIACAAIGDVIAWCILAFAVSIASTTGVGDGVVTTLLAFSYVAVMLFGVRPLLARLAARVGTSRAMSQNVVALVLLLVIVSGWVSARIGIHVLFGAFLFGVIFPKEGGFARALAEKLEDVVVVLLLPLFFAMSGLRTEIGLLGSANHLAICGAIIAVASVGKFGGSAIAARLTGMSWRESGAIGVLMNTRGLLELIVLNIGLELGLLSPTLFSMMVIMALVTTFVGAPLLQRIYPANAMARDLLEDEPPPVIVRTASRVMVCVSDGSAGPGLVEVAKMLASTHGEVIVLHLMNPSDRSSARVGEPADEAGEVMRPALEYAKQNGITVRPLSFVSTDLAEDIARVADVRGVEVALLGLHKPVLTQTFLGGVVHDVMQRADVTVAVYVARQAAETRRVLVPFQGSPHDRAALALAARVQETTGSEITVLQVVRPGGTSSAAHAIDGFAETGGKVLVQTVEHRSPAVAAIERAADFDLVIVGVGEEWGLGDRKLAFGLQSERLIRECPTSLLVVRGARESNDAVRNNLATARVASE
jgi:Kef-type K+ transport system membrane component KefB/nucleotide-binding universal stress UspA family protein